MTVVRGTLRTSLEGAEETARRVGVQQGMTYFAPGSRPGDACFQDGYLGVGAEVDGFVVGARTVHG